MTNNPINPRFSSVLTAPGARTSAAGRQRSGAEGLSFENLLSNSRRDAMVQPGRVERPQASQNDQVARDLNGTHTAEEEAVVVNEQPQEQETAEAEEAAPVYAEVAVIAIDKMEDAVLAEIAAILGIEPYVLKDIIVEMEVDVAELVQKEVQIELIKIVYEMESDAELLTLPDALPIMEEITKVVEDFVQKLPQYRGYVLEESEMPLEAEIIAQTEVIELETPELQTTEAVTRPQAPQATDNTAQAAELAETATAVPEQQIVAPEPIAAFNPIASNAASDGIMPEIVTDAPQAPVSPQNVMEQIVSSMRVVTQGTLAEIRIQLKPEHLGEVSLRISTQNGIVVAQFVAESQRVKEIIEAGFNRLRESLEEQGINVQQIEVSVGNGESGGEREFSFGGDISSERIRELMAASEEEVLEEPGLEAAMVDYRI